MRRLRLALSAVWALLLASCVADRPSARGDGAVTELALTSLDGAPVTLSRYEGRVLLVDFWASWCGPCRDQLAQYARLFVEKEDRGLTVLAVNAGESPEAVAAYLRDLPLPFPVARDADGSLAQALEVAALPTSVLFDRRGRVAARFTGADADSESVLRATVETLLSEPPK
ncbi:MAG TPA: TlpA disulfide reductase family protein [Myxococcaceae bacterium]|nr:TlpA disulfide reductase family protein [Myxococcaceae bacterium]